jgi:hypothetical protein
MLNYRTESSSVKQKEVYLMDLLATSAAATGRLALAAAFNGPPLARVAPRPKDGGVSSKQEVLRAGWSLSEALVNAVVAAGWLSERRTLRGRPLARDAKAAVTFKDLLVAGAVITSSPASLARR